MESFLGALTIIAMLSIVVSFVVYVIRAIQKKDKKWSGVILLISFGVFIIAGTIGSQLYPVADKKKQTQYDLPENTFESAESTDEIKKVAEFIVTPEKGKKLTVIGKKINFRISEIKQDTVGLVISLAADTRIPLDNIEGPVRMQVSKGKQTINSSKTELSGMILGYDSDKFFVEGTVLMGKILFSFPIEEMPDKIIVFNKENKRIEFKVKAVKTK